MYFPRSIRTLWAMLARSGHRARWAAAWILLAVWFVSLVTGFGGALANLVLVLAVVVLLYELLAVDR